MGSGFQVRGLRLKLKVSDVRNKDLSFGFRFWGFWILDFGL